MKIGRGSGQMLKAWHFAALATALAFGLAFHQLGYESFWIDEMITRGWAYKPFAEIWPRTASSFHPPLYFWFMHGWVRLGTFPADEFWLRLPSAFFFALTVPMVYRLGRILGGTPRAGVFAAFLAATFPFLLHYGQEARSYAMLTFFAAWGFVVVAHLVSRSRTPERPRFIGAGLGDACRLAARGDLSSARNALGDDGLWVGYIVSSVIVMFLHSTAALFPVVTGAILLCAIWLAPSFRGVRFVNLCIAGAFIALCYSPHVLALISGARRIHRPPLTLDQVTGMFLQTYGIQYSGAWFWPTLFVLSGLVAFALATWARGRQWHWVAFAVLGWLGMLVLLTVFSFWKSMLLPKFLIWTLPPFLAVCAAGLAFLPSRIVRFSLLAGLLAATLHAAPRIWSHVHQDWRTVARNIARDASSPETALVSCPAWIDGIARGYWRFDGVRVEVDTYGMRRAREPQGSVEKIVFDRLNPRRPAGFGPAGLFPKYRRVHVVMVNCDREMLDALHAGLSETGRLVEKPKMPRRLAWRLYERKE